MRQTSAVLIEPAFQKTNKQKERISMGGIGGEARRLGRRLSSQWSAPQIEACEQTEAQKEASQHCLGHWRNHSKG